MPPSPAPCSQTQEQGRLVLNELKVFIIELILENRATVTIVSWEHDECLSCCAVLHQLYHVDAGKDICGLALFIKNDFYLKCLG